MKFKIIHTTTYTFTAPVFLEPHFLRFRPSWTPYLEVDSFNLHVDEPIAGHKILRDEEYNIVDFYWFQGMVEKLTLTAITTLSTTPFNPFNFLIHPQAYNQVPFDNDNLRAELLSAALVTMTLSSDLVRYCTSILQSSEGKTLPFLTQITRNIHKDFTVSYREEGAPYHPDETYALKEGSCRDLSWMLIHLLRQLGIPARFVSGYYYFEMEEPSYELHAWVAAFIPGAGWLGLDASHGILTGNTHFPIAASAHYDQTMPVSGGIRGSATSQLETSLTIERL